MKRIVRFDGFKHALVDALDRARDDTARRSLGSAAYESAKRRAAYRKAFGARVNAIVTERRAAHALKFADIASAEDAQAHAHAVRLAALPPSAPRAAACEPWPIQHAVRLAELPPSARAAVNDAYVASRVANVASCYEWRDRWEAADDAMNEIFTDNPKLATLYRTVPGLKFDAARAALSDEDRDTYDAVLAGVDDARRGYDAICADRAAEAASDAARAHYLSVARDARISTLTPFARLSIKFFRSCARIAKAAGSILVFCLLLLKLIPSLSVIVVCYVIASLVMIPYVAVFRWRECLAVIAALPTALRALMANPEAKNAHDETFDKRAA